MGPFASSLLILPLSLTPHGGVVFPPHGPCDPRRGTCDHRLTVKVIYKPSLQLRKLRKTLTSPLHQQHYEIQNLKPISQIKM